jgi:predicted lipoprotein
MSNASRASSQAVKTLVGAAVLVAVVVAMVLGTKFVTPEEAAALNPAAFDAKVFADENFPKVVADLTEKATDITVLAPAVAKDPAVAGEQYGADIGSGRFAFPVKATGTVTEVDANFMLLSVPGLAAQEQVRVPVGAALNGTPVRDAPGTITFGDFVGQTDFQAVANEFKLKMQSEVLGAVDPPSLTGKQITVVGAYASGGPPNSYIIQPVSIEEAA